MEFRLKFQLCLVTAQLEAQFLICEMGISATYWKDVHGNWQVTEIQVN